MNLSNVLKVEDIPILLRYHFHIIGVKFCLRISQKRACIGTGWILLYFDQAFYNQFQSGFCDLKLFYQEELQKTVGSSLHS